MIFKCFHGFHIFVFCFQIRPSFLTFSIFHLFKSHQFRLKALNPFRLNNPFRFKKLNPFRLKVLNPIRLNSIRCIADLGFVRKCIQKTRVWGRYTEKTCAQCVGERVRTVRHSTMRHGAVGRSAARYGAVRYGAVGHSGERMRTVRYSTIRHGTVGRSAARYGAVRHGAVGHSEDDKGSEGNKYIEKTCTPCGGGEILHTSKAMVIRRQ